MEILTALLRYILHIIKSTLFSEQLILVIL
jgi:hypothetical protein